MNRIDLTLQATDGASPISVFLQSPLGSGVIASSIPAELLQLLEGWRRRFLRHHDTNGPGLEAGFVEAAGTRLCDTLQTWLRQPEWEPLQRLLEAQAGLPLRIRCRPVGSPLARLPWDCLPLGRPIWRLASTAPLVVATAEPPVRRPRLLLLIGEDNGLDLTAEIEQLQRLQQRGGLELLTLRGSRSTTTELARQLCDRRGWDGLLYLGHSDEAPSTGGRLLLGDGRWLTGQELRSLVEAAPAHVSRPSFVLLNSCLGLDLADSCLAAGVAWVVCFRERVPSHGASQAFCELLRRLQSGSGFAEAVAAVRQHLSESGPAGCALLLSAVCSDTAPPLRLPLSRRRQFRQRLARSSRAQAIAATAWVAVGLAMDLHPSLPPGPGLLDQRLEWQRRWRVLTGQPGPSRPPLPVLLLDDGPTAAALTVTPTPDRVPRKALARVLQRVAPDAVPVVGLDVVLDEPAPHTAELVKVLRRQRRRRVLVGYFSRNAPAERAGPERTMPLPELLASGLQAFDLDTGIAPVSSGPREGRAFPEPLRVLNHLSAGSFAHQIARALLPSRPPAEFPYDAVIDWSLDWSGLLSNLLITNGRVNQLGTLRTPVLLVGTDGTINEKEPDLFLAPLAISGALERWGLQEGKLPGPLLQAALAQSMTMHHWLEPQLQGPTTALTAGLGVLLAAAFSRRRQRWLPVLAISAAAVPLMLQVGVGQKILLPVALPLLAFATTALIRHD